MKLQGAIIKAWSQSNHETRASLASSLNVKPTYISQVFAGKLEPSDGRLDRIIEELELDRLHTYLLVGRWPEEWRELDREAFYDALRKQVGVNP